MKLLVINGPNLNMLGIREPEIYGTQTYNDLVQYILSERGIDGVSDYQGERHEISFLQSNHEGELIDSIHQAYFDGCDGIIINPGAYTHTSIALLDALKSVPIPAVEVHITNPEERGDFRKVSYVAMAVKKRILGHGAEGYIEAIDYLTQ